MLKLEKRAKVLLTLREASKRLGVSDKLLTELVLVHPPIIDIMLVGRAPRVYAHQLTALRRRLVDLTIALINRNPPLLGLALGSVRGRSLVTPHHNLNVSELRNIITSKSVLGSD